MQTLDGNMDDAATHGTRSRNRNTGNSRINYAEDQEMDLDFTSAASTSKKKTALESAAQMPAIGELKRSGDQPRSMAGGSKDSTPVAAASVSKKRKAAGGMPQHLQTPPVSASPAAVVMRRPATAASSASARESNVTTFMKHKSCLNKKGELVADDGTKLAINGKSDPQHLLFRDSNLPRFVRDDVRFRLLT